MAKGKREPIELLHPREEDEFGDPIGDPNQWREEIALNVVPRSSEDYEQRGQIIIHGFMIVVAGSVLVTDQDKVKVRGREYVIDGAIGDYGRKKIFFVKRPN